MTTSNSKAVGREKCKYCSRSCVRSFAIICAECTDFMLCGDCFCAGVELGNHKNNHKYKVADCLEFPLFVKDWSVSDELALLEGRIANPFASVNSWTVTLSQF